MAETVHHTVTVFADSPSYPAVSTDAVAELAAKRQLEARQFEGFVDLSASSLDRRDAQMRTRLIPSVQNDRARLSFVTDTKTVVSTLSAPPSTVTVTALASAAPNTTVRTITPEASTVTQTVTQMQSVPPSTVTQTVTTAESLPGGNATRTVTSTVTASCTGQVSFFVLRPADLGQPLNMAPCREPLYPHPPSSSLPALQTPALS